MTSEIPAEALEFIDGPNFATVATIQPDGSPQLSVVWVTREGQDVVFSTTRGRRKELNLEADNRCTLLISDPANPYSYVEIRGTTTMTEEGGRELIDALAKKYLDKDRYPWDDGTDNVRVVVRVTPTRVVFLQPR
ncbi:MAG: PPOX class F420-dependent oxidoreductase [Actinobacteria bacterium]|nr:PPOX class F420-dependent oxidoreductase [Actinomycetota bacterium]